MDHRRTEEHKLASRTAISSCTVCKKHFRTSQIFVEHLQSQEHRQKLEKLQENEGCEALGKLTAMDADGFSLEEVEGGEVEEVEERHRNEQDDWPFPKEVTLKDMASDEQYDPDTVYGSSFFVPVAGFICRLCNKFYHFESSALHTHCKSLKHFENLKRYRELLSQKSGAVESSRESPLAAGSPRPITETPTDCLDENSLPDETVVTEINSTQPLITLTRLNTQTNEQQQKEQAEPDPTSRDSISASATSKEEETTSQVPVVQESPAELPAVNTEEPDSEPAAAAVVADANEEEEEEEEAPTVTGKRNGTAKAKTTSKRRSGRATNRRWGKAKMWSEWKLGTTLGQGVSVCEKVLSWNRDQEVSEQPCLSLCRKVGIKHTPTNRKKNGKSQRNMTYYVLLSQGGKLTPHSIKYRLNQWWVSILILAPSQNVMFQSRLISSLTYVTHCICV